MLIRVNRSSDVPLYRQIIAQVQAQIAAGRLGPGDRLPSVRDLAVDIRINPNTVARAYRELESMGVIVTQGAQGSYVADGFGARAMRELESDFRRRLWDAVATGSSMGIDHTRMREILEEILAEVDEKHVRHRAAG